MSPRLVIRAEKIEAKYLKPGDLFSEYGPEYWSSTKFPAAPLMVCLRVIHEDDTQYYRITYERPRLPDRIPRDDEPIPKPTIEYDPEKAPGT